MVLKSIPSSSCLRFHARLRKTSSALSDCCNDRHDVESTSETTMQSIDSLVEQHIRESEAHLRHIEFEKAVTAIFDTRGV